MLPFKNTACKGCSHLEYWGGWASFSAHSLSIRYVIGEMATCSLFSCFNRSVFCFHYNCSRKSSYAQVYFNKMLSKMLLLCATKSIAVFYYPPHPRKFTCFKYVYQKNVSRYMYI